MRLFRPCFISVRLFPEALFRVSTSEKVLYLTFDDGPDVLSTPPLLGILSHHNIKAVFFCSGKEASENPDLIEMIKKGGHVIGNHGYNHPNGFVTGTQKYLDDIYLASTVTSSSLFRPPYGRLRLSQYRELKKKFRIIMWDLMPYDFDRSFGSERSLSCLKRFIRPGSVIVLHDIACSTLNDFLENFIGFAKEAGYRFGILS